MSFLGSPARRSVLRVTGVVVAVGLAAAGSSAYVFAAGAGSGQKASGQEVSGRAVSSQPPAGLRHAADQLVADGVPGVIIMTRRGQQVSNVVAGLADKATGQPMQPQDKVRIGSITKTFVATVVLQLAAERRLSLNDSVQKWLPGVITGHGYHPAQITIRQLLQQTSGIQDYTSAPGFLTEANLAKTWQPQQLVDIALRLGPPVHGWLYSDTNYILLGMIIQKVTGRSPVTEISRRILVPLGLHDTSFPLTSKQIPAPYAHGYYGSLDVTNLVSPSIAWTAGAMISTVDDVARFVGPRTVVAAVEPDRAADGTHAVAEELRPRRVGQDADPVMRRDVILGEPSSFGERRRIEPDARPRREYLKRLVGMAYPGFHLDGEDRLHVDRVGDELLDAAGIYVADRGVLGIRLLLLRHDQCARLRVRRQ